LPRSPATSPATSAAQPSVRLAWPASTWSCRSSGRAVWAWGTELAASVGAALGWISWQALLTGTFTAFALAADYGGALMVLHRATRTSHLPLGPFILIGTLAAIAL
jgi:hypothetical protein